MTSSIGTTVLVGILVLIGILVLLRFTSLWDKVLTARTYRPVDFNNLKTTRHPNWYLVCPPQFCSNAAVHREAPVFNKPASDLAAQLKELIKAEGNLNVRHEDATTFDVEIRTAVMRWPDLVSIEFIETEDGGCTLAIFSRSIYGRKDFGANRKRVNRWLGSLGAAT